MPNTEPVVVDADTAQRLRAAANREGITVADYLDRLERRGARQPGYRAPEAPASPRPPRSLEDRIADITKLRQENALTGILEGATRQEPRERGEGDRDLDRRLERIERHLENPPKAPAAGGLDMTGMVQQAIAGKIALSIFKDDDGGMNKTLQPIIDDLKKQIASGIQETAGLKTTIATQKATEKEQKILGALEGLGAKVESLAEENADLREQLRHPPQDAGGGTAAFGIDVTKLGELASNLENAKKSFNQIQNVFTGRLPSTEPEDPTLKKIKAALEMGGDFLTKAMDSAGGLVAANKTGVAPREHARMIEHNAGPAPPPVIVPPAPAAASPPRVAASSPETEGAAPPPPPVRAPPPAAEEPAAPSENYDETRLPASAKATLGDATHFVDPETSQQVTRQEFLNKYGSIIEEHPDALQAEPGASEAPQE